MSINISKEEVKSTNNSELIIKVKDSKKICNNNPIKINYNTEFFNSKFIKTNSRSGFVGKKFHKYDKFNTSYSESKTSRSALISTANLNNSQKLTVDGYPGRKPHLSNLDCFQNHPD